MARSRMARTRGLRHQAARHYHHGVQLRATTGASYVARNLIPWGGLSKPWLKGFHPKHPQSSCHSSPSLIFVFPDVVHAVDGLGADVVGGTDGVASLDAAAGEPHGHGFGVVVAAIAGAATTQPLSGVRPNSPHQTTRVSFNSPRSLRSRSRAAMGLSTERISEPCAL
jgi:hypothetical protein